MAKTRHKADATPRIDVYISELPDWSRKICVKLRSLILQSDAAMIEDWKWGPNYSLEGMVCGIIANKKHVSLVFFKGMHLKDKGKLLQGNPDNLNIRSLRFTNVSEINADVVLEYVMEAIDNNRAGVKLNKSKDKTVEVPIKIKKVFISAGVWQAFEQSSYTHRKTYIAWIKQARKEETSKRRLEKVIYLLGKKAIKSTVGK